MKCRPELTLSKLHRFAYVKNALLTVDELGYQSLERNDIHLFFQFISARYMHSSTIIISNRPVKEKVSPSPMFGQKMSLFKVEFGPAFNDFINPFPCQRYKPVR
ncbi:MAG: ATP-binding protein, partial [Candidatus Helarchaeota archaeon]